MTAEHAQKLMQQYQDILSQGEIVISDIDPDKSEDRLMALETALRGKTVEEYFEIVGGLFRAHDAETDLEKRNSLHDLTCMIMSIGERNLGIDWS